MTSMLSILYAVLLVGLLLCALVGILSFIVEDIGRLRRGERVRPLLKQLGMVERRGGKEQVRCRTCRP